MLPDANAAIAISLLATISRYEPARTEIKRLNILSALGSATGKHVLKLQRNMGMEEHYPD
jgi:hypothetical protein